MATFTKRIDSGIRNLWDWNNGSWNVSTTLERMGNLSGTISGVSLRFTNVTIGAGSTITSAKITFRATNTKSNTNLVLIIHGVDEDNTGEFTTSPIDDARTRNHTTANVAWSGAISWTSGSNYDTPDLTSIIQEIIDRGGWASGNTIAISIQDNGSGTNQYVNNRAYEFDTANAALLTITYTGSSPSASISPSSSISPSPSVSVSLSNSPSPSPSVATTVGIMKIAKSGKNVLTSTNPNDFIFDSDYGTLKYYTKQTKQVTFTAGAPDLFISGSATYTHNLGYYPFTEVFVRVYIGAPTGNYEYCPFFGSGASVAYSANYKITTSDIIVYGSVDGVSSSTWVFDFLIFVYKNNLNL